MSVQREVKLMQRNADGTTQPFVCEKCGEQRIGLILNIATQTLLPCRCEKRKP